MPGAVNVMPAGLGGVLAKRASREVKMEVRANKFCIRYLVARIFMLSGTDRKNALFTCMTKIYCDELGAFKPSFYHQN